ncbi:MAG TPA: ChbG/HpnK family deacetylase [Thermoanaerobaculia bacterium]|nr:ChbG/HpnK family deacetylase [Thermoanaerobaculia bacterium]
MKQLIVTADDVGLTSGMTEGAIRAHRQGIVTACSIVANGNAFDDAVARLRDVPSLEVGAHLALVEERALTTGEPMPKSYVQFVLSRRRIDVERELRAQLEKILATGLRITHLNGHQHLHMLPSVFAIVRRLAGEHGIPYVRVVNDRGGRGGIARRGSIAVLSMLGRRVDAKRKTIGVMEAGHLTAARVIELFDEVDGVTELVTHPGVAVSGYEWGYDWDAETEALCDPALKTALDARGIRLATPSTI